MKKLSLKLLLATVILASTSISAYAQTEKVDTPKECKKLKRYAQKNQVTKIDKFFEKHPNFSADCVSNDIERSTPMTFAASFYSLEAAEALIKYGADVNYQSAKKNVPFISMTSFIPPIKDEAENTARIVEMINILKNAGGNINYIKPNGTTPLSNAVMNLNYKSIDLLVANGADINYKFPNGSTLKDAAIYQSRRARENNLNWWGAEQLKIFDKYNIKAKVPYYIDDPEFPKYDWSNDVRYQGYYQTEAGINSKKATKKIKVQNNPRTYECTETEYENLTDAEGAACLLYTSPSPRDRG